MVTIDEPHQHYDAQHILRHIITPITCYCCDDGFANPLMISTAVKLTGTTMDLMTYTICVIIEKRHREVLSVSAGCVGADYVLTSGVVAKTMCSPQVFL